MLPLCELDDSDFCLPLQRIKIYMHTIDIDQKTILEHSYISFVISFLGSYTIKKLLKS